MRDEEKELEAQHNSYIYVCAYKKRANIIIIIMLHIILPPLTRKLQKIMEIVQI